jgi:hypothetical protein
MLEIHGLDWTRHKHGSVMSYKQKSIAQMHITTHLLGLGYASFMTQNTRVCIDNYILIHS